jgi:hypothetical protein
MSAADSASLSRTEVVPPPPSTQLGYETADSERNRLLVEKRMKVSLRDGDAGRRVASVGTVKDSTESSTAGGVGNRVRGRHRTKT